MQKWLLFGIFACLLLMHAASAEQESYTELENVLRGAKIGMSFDDFVDTHPEAAYSDEAMRDTPVTKEQPGSMLIVHDQDPFLGHYQFSNFGFKDKRLYELVAVWKGEARAMRARAAQFFGAIIQRHGKKYERKSMFVFPDSTDERVVAVFYWKSKDHVSLAFYTPPKADEEDPIGILSYAQFSPDTAFLKDLFEEKAVPADRNAEAWASMDDIVKALPL